MPYTVSYIGLIYNTTMVEEAPDSWTALWDERYSGKILMINNPRDAFAIAQSILGMDYNTDAPAAWRTAAELLKEQKRVNPNYVNDEVFLKMESGEAALAPYFVGDYLTMKENNPDLAFVYPKEGVNYFFDSACILKGSKNKLAAELYINFLLEPDVALANAEYICYGSPHSEVYNNPDYTYYHDETLYPEEGASRLSFSGICSRRRWLYEPLWETSQNYIPSGVSPNSFSSAAQYRSRAKRRRRKKNDRGDRQIRCLHRRFRAHLPCLCVIFRYARKKNTEKV